MSFLKKVGATLSNWVGKGLETVGALPAVGQLTGGLFSGVGSALTDYLTHNLGTSTAKDLLRTQNNQNLSYALQSARALPSAQVEGLRAAGINPIAAYGQIGGQLSGGSASPMVATGQSDFGLYSAARLMNAQVDMARAQADEARANASIQRAREKVETNPVVLKADVVGRVASAAKDVAAPVVAGVGAYALAKRKSAKREGVNGKSAKSEQRGTKFKPAKSGQRGTKFKPAKSVPRGINSARSVLPVLSSPTVFGGVNPDALRDSGFGVRHMYRPNGMRHAPLLQ